MEPQQITDESLTNNQTNEVTCAWYSPLCKVTTTSKILAAVIFIILPFVGGYIGYKVASETTEKVSAPVMSVDSKTFVKKAGDKSIRYILPADWNEYAKDSANFSKVETLNNVLIKGEDESVKNFGQAPYFTQLIASTSDYLIFCSPPFGKAGSCNWLYKYSKSTQELAEMKSSSLYNPAFTSAVISLDQTKIALVHIGNNEENRDKEIGYINLVDDTYTTLKNLSSSSDSSFSDCDEEQIICGTKITWLDNNTITAEVYPICAETNSCSSVSKQTEVLTIKIGKK